MPKKQKNYQGNGAGNYSRRLSHGKDKQIRKALRRQRHAAKFLDENDKSFISLNIQLKSSGLKLKQIIGDGNCLFRALADQYEQDHTKHKDYRHEVCQYILQNAPDFRPWVEDEMTLEDFSKFHLLGLLCNREVYTGLRLGDCYFYSNPIMRGLQIFFDRCSVSLTLLTT